MKTSITAAAQQHTRRHYWKTHPEKFKGMRQSEIANTLGISEGEWVDACVGFESKRLIDDPRKFISMLPFLGEVKIVTQSPSVVHEKIGAFDHIVFDRPGNTITVNNFDVDLIIDPAHWHSIYAVRVRKGRQVQHSLQVFDHAGMAVHKIFMMPQTRQKPWQSFVASRLHPNPTPFKAQKKLPPKTRPSEGIFFQGFRDHWDNMLDIQEFPALLRRYNLKPIQALRYAGGDRAIRVEHSQIDQLLKTAANQQTPLQIQISNHGCTQTHTGPIQNLVKHLEWVAIFDESFNLHLRHDQVAEAWTVKKPTVDGIVTTLEIFDAQENNILTIAGEKIRGIREPKAWRHLVTQLPPHFPSDVFEPLWDFETQLAI